MALSIPHVLSIVGLQGFVAMLVFLFLTKGWGLSDILNTGVFSADLAPLKFLNPQMNTQGVQALAWDEMISECRCSTM